MLPVRAYSSCNDLFFLQCCIHHAQADSMNVLCRGIKEPLPWSGFYHSILRVFIQEYFLRLHMCVSLILFHVLPTHSRRRRLTVWLFPRAMNQTETSASIWRMPREAKTPGAGKCRIQKQFRYYSAWIAVTEGITKSPGTVSPQHRGFLKRGGYYPLGRISIIFIFCSIKGGGSLTIHSLARGSGFIQ